jgi:prepilin peptidase CpaA
MPEITDNSLPSYGIAGLLVVALAAAWHDWFHWRIPNRLLAAGSAAALMLATFAPDSLGIRHCLVGGLIGFALLWPFYWVGGMAAGDVKLMATLGLFAGPAAIVDITLISFLIGGLWSIVMLINRTDTAALLYARLRMMSWTVLPLPMRDTPPPIHTGSRGVIPYGVVIALGVVVSMTLDQIFV